MRYKFDFSEVQPSFNMILANINKKLMRRAVRFELDELRKVWTGIEIQRRRKTHWNDSCSIITYLASLGWARYNPYSMIRQVACKVSLLGQSMRFGVSSLDAHTFLRTVESFYGRAGVHTGIRSDRLNYYKKAENTVKCTIPLVKGR